MNGAETPTPRQLMDSYCTLNPDRTDDDWLTDTQFALREWEWHDGSEQT